jgi:S-adenosylmethionine decarboxylase
MEVSDKKIQLHGFNNLTKTLSFNFYDICYARTPEHQQEYLEYVDEEYNAARLEAVLREVTKQIGANVLNMSTYDYEPRGASVTCLISEEPDLAEAIFSKENTSFEQVPSNTNHSDASRSVVGHLDKSHVTAHTYPEYHPDNGISTFRVDIDVSTCGRVSPLKALDYLIDSFNEDIVILDYRVRGFTRDIEGLKHYIDHDITSIQDFLSDKTKKQYQMIDMNVGQENIFHTKMLLNEFKLDSYLFGKGLDALNNVEQQKIEESLKNEMSEIFYGINSLD